MTAFGWIHIDCDVLGETDLAFRIRLLGSEDVIWIPKSEIAYPAQYNSGDKKASMSISEYIAEQKGIEL